MAAGAIMQDESGGVPALLWGAGWLGAALRGLVLFTLLYVVPGISLAPASRATPALQLAASALAFVFLALAIYRFAQQRVYRDAFEEVEVQAEDGDEDEAEEAAPAEPAKFDPMKLGQAALERVSIALYRFNGLRSETVALSAGGGYRIRLFPRNEEKPMGLLLCSAANGAPQGYDAYDKLLQAMDDEGVGKAFFVAPAGFVPQVVALARGRHVTLVDDKLMLALIERLPEHVRAEVIAAAQK